MCAPTTSMRDSKKLVGDEYSVKDLRTWHGTVLAAAAFADADPAVTQRVSKRVESAVMREVAEELGNTPAVARGSYVDPRVVAGYQQGLTIAAAAHRAKRARRADAAQQVLEKATRMLVRRIARMPILPGPRSWPRRRDDAIIQRAAMISMLECVVRAFAVRFAVEHGEAAGVGEAPTLCDFAHGRFGVAAVHQVPMSAV